MKTRWYSAAPMALFLASGTLCAQETRSTIFGRVLDPSHSAVSGAAVVVTNTGTGTSARLTTNETGYFEASLLLPGDYEVSAEATGFRRSVRKGIQLSVSSRLEVTVSVEIGAVTESVSVTAQAPLLDTSTASSGWVLDNRSLMELPVLTNNTALLAKLTPGVQTAGVNYYSGLHATGLSSQVSTGGNIGGNEWTVDGAPNNGSGRNMAYVPYSDTVQEVKVETSNFDASIGHATGASISMMTKAGTNSFHGTATWQHWQNRWQGASFFAKQVYYRNIAAAKANGDTGLADQLRRQPILPAGRSNNYAATIGGPLTIPKVVNGKNKLFFFFAFNGYKDLSNELGSNVNNTIPTMANRQGDFSQLLKVDAVRYQLYDPLSVRPDPARAGHFVRTPIAGNIFPAGRINNPAYNAYVKFLPVPNNDPLDPTKEPRNNYLAVAIPQGFDYKALTNRLDYQPSDRHRFFGRWSWNHFLEDRTDWTYQSAPGLHTNGNIRDNLAATADWVWTKSAATVVNLTLAGNQFAIGDTNPGTRKYKPSDVGLPAYLDQKAGDLHVLPQMNVSGYQSIGKSGYSDVVNYRMFTLKGDVSRIRGRHTLRAGADARNHVRSGGVGGNTSGNFGFGNTYFKKNDDSFTPAGDLGLGWAAFMMGLPNSMTIATNDTYVMSNPYVGLFVQDNWRITPRLSLNIGLRAEYEYGRKERFNRVIGYFDPKAKLPITDAAQAAYGRSPIPELAATNFAVNGGSLYPGTGGLADRLNQNQLMWLPRFAAAYQVNTKTVIRGGYGVFYDTANVNVIGPDQFGFSRSTSTNLTNDFGQTWLAGDPARGVSALTDPFPIRSGGTRYDEPVRDQLGLMARAGRGFSYTAYDSVRARQQRWRIGIQRQLGSNMLIDATYSGTRAGDIETGKKLDILPQQYWATGLQRNDAIATNLNQNVTNPYLLKNFAGLEQSLPLIYQDMSTQSFYTSSTIRKNQLLRPYSQMNGLTSSRVPLGESRTDSLEVYFQRRFSKGFNLNLAYTRLRGYDADYYYNEWDSRPSWRETNDGRPHRFTGTGVWELPFGRGHRLAPGGLAGWIFGGYQISLTYEFQPGPLLDFSNLFYYGNLNDIATGNKTLDRWFNTAGFETNSAKGPNSFHSRVFPTHVPNVRRDMTNQWNGNVQREFRLRERTWLQLRCDLLNLQNRSQFDAPDRSPYSTNFGKITAQTNATNRFVQVQARIRF